jgi:NhaA family Na+:H+ antiporter
MNTFLRIIKNETFSAYLLIPVALIAVAIGANFDNHFLEAARQIGSWHFDLRGLTLDYLLGFFFYNIGLQLRFELSDGGLKDREVLILSGLAAILGMFVPAITFYLFNRFNGTPTTGWGITMATDLPFVLAALVVMKRNSLKGFVLALATIDDIGSVIVLSLIYKVHLHLLYLLALLAVLAIYFAASYFTQSKLALIAIFAVGLGVGHQTGIQTSLVAVLFGAITYKNQRRGRDLHDTLLSVVEPFSLGDAFVIGVLGTLGLDVSLIFAQKDFLGANQNLAIFAILVTIPAALLLTLITHLVSLRAKNL